MARGKSSKKSPQKRASAQKKQDGGPESTIRTRSKSGHKKFEGKAENDELGQALAQLGLRIRKVTADGNCFFRACSDQLFGGEGHHHSLRSDVVQFMADHDSDFAVFMEDDENFDNYCKRMRKDGIWAGQHEQVALTRLKGVKICVHQCGQPCWTIAPDFPEISKDARTLHLSYHNGEHYNSVRLADDLGGQPATPILITGGQACSAQPNKAKAKTSHEPAEAKTLEDVGDSAVDTTVEANSATGQQNETDQAKSADQQSEILEPLSDLPKTTGEEAKSDLSRESAAVDNAVKEDDLQGSFAGDRPSADGVSTDDVKSRAKQKKPTRNGHCPCGSKRRYKECCLLLKRAEARRMAQQPIAVNDEPGRQIKMETIFV